MSWQGVTIFRHEPEDAALAVTPPGDNDVVTPGFGDGGILEPLLPRGGGEKEDDAQEEWRADRRGCSHFAVRNVCLEVKSGEVRKTLFK